MTQDNYSKLLEAAVLMGEELERKVDAMGAWLEANATPLKQENGSDKPA